MTTRKSISKRKYPAWVEAKTGKWFTGYEGDVITDPDKEHWYGRKICREVEHFTQRLKLQPSHTSRGRSAANIVCVDEDGYNYLMSLKSVDNFLHKLVSGEIVIADGYFEAEFCQVKQGKNYFIDLVED